MKNINRYTVTAALPYANGPLHIGHIAGAYLPADIYVRYLRLQKKDVAFICGSDEYGAAITMRAKKEGISPKQIIDKYHHSIKEAFEQFGIAFDIYHRTSEQVHTQTAQEFFKVLEQKGEFEKQTSEQYFDQVANQFLADRYIQGTCPKCSNPNAYGDQCEKCGSTLSPTDLIEPRSTLSGATPILKSTTHWYLPLNKYENWLKEWIVKEKQNIWKTNVYGQCRSWIEQGLQPRAMTRDLDWGIPVPLPNAEGKVLYVWLDAPIGYISATKAWAEQTGKDWKDYWQKDDTALIHFVGKDNIVFHCIIFPIVLKANGNYILPTNVPANEFLNLEGDKISTSRNWAVWVHEYLQDFPDKQDVLRYVLNTILPETKDSEFTWKDYQAKNNSELVAILGNFVNRAVVLTHKYYQGIVPQPDQLTAYDQQVLEQLGQAAHRIGTAIEHFAFREALAEAMNVARLGNKYLQDSEPWKIKDNPSRVQTIIYVSLQIVSQLSVLLKPFLPQTAQKIDRMLGFDGSLEWEDAGKIGLLAAGQQLAQPELLFSQIEDATIAAQVEKLEKTKTAQQTQVQIPIKENISFDDFGKLDLRIATITAAEKVAKAKKLLKLTLNTGIDTRTVVSGIAEFYQPEEVIGKQVVLLANLAPKDLRGVESKGMILMAEDANGKLCFVSPTELIKEGSIVR